MRYCISSLVYILKRVFVLGIGAKFTLILDSFKCTKDKANDASSAFCTMLCDVGGGRDGGGSSSDGGGGSGGVAGG